VFQVVISSSQLAGACANELVDVQTDSVNQNRTWFSGGSGMIVSGRITLRFARYALLFLLLVVLAASIVLAFPMDAGVLSFLLMMLGLSLAVSYSLRPLKLSYRGLGELSMAFMVSFLTPGLAFFLQYRAFDAEIVWVTLPIVLQMMGLMMFVEFPDRDADMAAGKKNLAVRLGPGNSWNLGVTMFLLGGSLALAGHWMGIPMVTAVTLGTVLIGGGWVLWVSGTIPQSRRRHFWTSAVSCILYALVILSGALTLLYA
jgi:1,4-dihydroxy-2-naphthoate octaprenyltransferase